MDPLQNRRASILSTREVVDLEEIPVYVKNKRLVPQKEGFASSVFVVLLERKLKSKTTAAFAEAVFGLLIDHGGEVSGAVNTMISARAGKDLVSSLASGLLTIGPRFGGAVNAAALQWLDGVEGKEKAASFVEKRTKGGNLLAGIGHRKYRVGIPDPRVAAISEFASLLKTHPHYDFARAVEEVTTRKSGNLILNIDGVIAALALDILAECEKCSPRGVARTRGGRILQRAVRYPTLRRIYRALYGAEEERRRPFPIAGRIVICTKAEIGRTNALLFLPASISDISGSN